MENGGTIVALKKEELETMMQNAAMVGAKVAADALKESYSRQDAERKRRQLHNTKLLLSHYREFKAHATKASFDSRKAESKDDLIRMLMEQKDDSMVLESVRRTAARTALIVSHIDSMVSVFRSFSEKDGAKGRRQYQAVYSYYLAEDRKTVSELAEEASVSRATIHSDLRQAEERLSVLFFGMDGLHFSEK